MCSCFFLHLGTKKWQANQPCGILATSKGTLCHNLLNFRVKAWVKLWVRLRITQVVFMVMVWEHLQETNPSVCNVLTSDENKVPACATCLPSEFLYPVLYNISRPHWFWNKHLPSRELGPPAKFVWSGLLALPLPSVETLVCDVISVIFTSFFLPLWWHTESSGNIDYLVRHI